MPNGAELFVQVAARLGLDPIFTLVGDHLNEVLAAAVRAGMRVVDMRHESGVTHAADAWARIHRRPALSLVTGGPGHTNSLTGIATANLAGSPLIAVSGSRARGLADRQAFQDIDQVGMTRPVVKWAAEVPSAGEIPFYLGRAFTEANSARRGAVHLTITMARGTVPDDHPLSMWYADPALNYAVHTVFREADLFLVAGKRIDYRLALGGPRLFAPEAKFIQIDIHPQELGMNRALDAAV